MKNFRKSISSNKLALNLFVKLSVVALFAAAGLLAWQTSARMESKMSEESRQAGQLWNIGKHQQTAIFDTNSTTNSSLIPTLGNYPNTTVAVGKNTTITPDAAPTGATSAS